MYQIGEQITITPTELVAGGESLARVDGFPIFTANLFPGDTALVRLTEVKKGFARAAVVRVEKPSELRRAEPCPVAEECGGCDWTALRLDAQLVAKRRILTESLRRIGKIDPATLPAIAIHPSPLNYRIRSRLHSDGVNVGFYAMGSHRVVPLARECEVVGIETARLCHSERSEEPGRGIGTASRPAHPGPSLNARDDMWELNGELITDERDITIHVDRYTYHLSTRAFFQVNRHLLATLLQLVWSAAAQAAAFHLAIDLYAGIGFFTLPLAEQFDRVISVEGSDISHHHAKRNVPANVELVHAPVEQWVANMPDADFVFLDPPRSGTRRNVIDAVALHTREKICFLACDPVTFARDASRLIASGWRLSTLDLIDLFPNTHHVETLASFERAQ